MVKASALVVQVLAIAAVVAGVALVSVPAACIVGGGLVFGAAERIGRVIK